MDKHWTEATDGSPIMHDTRTTLPMVETGMGLPRVTVSNGQLLGGSGNFTHVPLMRHSLLSVQFPFLRHETLPGWFGGDAPTQLPVRMS